MNLKFKKEAKKTVELNEWFLELGFSVTRAKNRDSQLCILFFHLHTPLPKQGSTKSDRRVRRPPQSTKRTTIHIDYRRRRHRLIIDWDPLIRTSSLLAHSLRLRTWPVYGLMTGGTKFLVRQERRTDTMDRAK